MESVKKLEVIKKLQEAGFIYRKDFTASARNAGYDEVVKVTVKNPAINLDRVSNICDRCDEYERDVDGEILQGGNTFVNAVYKSSTDEELYKEAQSNDIYLYNIFDEYAYKNYYDKALKVYQEAKKKIEGSKDSSIIIDLLEYGDFRLVISSDGYNNRIIETVFKHDYNKYFTRGEFCLHTILIDIAKLELKHFDQVFKKLNVKEYISISQEHDEEKDNLKIYKYLADRKETYNQYKNNEVLCDSFRYVCIDEGYIDLSGFEMSDIMPDTLKNICIGEYQKGSVSSNVSEWAKRNNFEYYGSEFEKDIYIIYGKKYAVKDYKVENLYGYDYLNIDLEKAVNPFAK